MWQTSICKRKNPFVCFVFAITELLFVASHFSHSIRLILPIFKWYLTFEILFIVVTLLSHNVSRSQVNRLQLYYRFSVAVIITLFTDPKTLSKRVICILFARESFREQNNRQKRPTTHLNVQFSLNPFQYFHTHSIVIVIVASFCSLNMPGE